MKNIIQALQWIFIKLRNILINRIAEHKSSIKNKKEPTILLNTHLGTGNCFDLENIINEIEEQYTSILIRIGIFL